MTSRSGRLRSLRIEAWLGFGVVVEKVRVRLGCEDLSGVSVKDDDVRSAKLSVRDSFSNSLLPLLTTELEGSSTLYRTAAALTQATIGGRQPGMVLPLSLDGRRTRPLTIRKSTRLGRDVIG